MEVLTLILNEAPHGDEKVWNALRVVRALTSAKIGMKVNIYLLGDAVNLAKKGQRTPGGYYNLEKMLKELAEQGVEVMACSMCLDARGLTEEDLIEGVEPGSTMLLAWWVKESQGVLSFWSLFDSHIRAP